MQISSRSKITSLKGVGTKMQDSFKKLDISNIKDLIRFIPFKYRDTTDIMDIESFKKVEEGTFLAQIVDVKNIFTRYGKNFTKVRVADNSNRIDLIYFNQTYLSKAFKPGDWYIFDGKISAKGKTKNIYNPTYEKYVGDSSMQITLGKIFGTYHETEGITSRQIRKLLLLIKNDIPRLIKEYLPKKLLEKEKIIGIGEALTQIHFPDSKESLQLARERLSFEEMLRIGIKIERQIEERSQKTSLPITIDEKLEKQFLKSLPYILTNDQQICIKKIFEDIQQNKPMNRLLNGDVGSGKTVVAATVILQTIKSGFSGILLAPTTVLAKQHFETLTQLLKPFKIDVELCISEKKTISDANNKLIIGTHAILFQKELPDDLNLVIVDEQHRFGVEQREHLLNIGENTPHYLTMTATPIPRSLTEVVFGSTQVSTIKEMPINRLDIKTKYVPVNKRIACFKWINKKIRDSKLTEQAFLIYPLIEDNESSVKSVKTQYKNLTNSYFSELKVALLHGKIKEKNKILTDFKKKKYNILISTSVIEVGIDIPDATIMVIENAERFGLAQLHQLRGRVGRGNLQSYCFIIPSENIEDRQQALKRLKYFTTHKSGFDVAEYDLAQRGPGEVYGLIQSGIPRFKIASLGDIELLKKTRRVARKLILEDNYNLNKIIKKLFK
ncbi:TPA: DNA helicase RecG [Patescibacteria group bacterium]|mgnify:CR=1 FL=1|nr:DNA helicase RecG [Patescibacteria group bacterium]